MGVAIVAAGVLLIASVACVVVAMVCARRDARSRRARELPRVHHPPTVGLAPAPELHPLQELNLRLRGERDPLVRMQLTMELAATGGGQAALVIVGAVRDGIIAPTAGAQAVSRTGFDGGVVAGIALHDPDPRVRALAHMVLEGAVRS